MRTELLGKIVVKKKGQRAEAQTKVLELNYDNNYQGWRLQKIFLAHTHTSLVQHPHNNIVKMGTARRGGLKILRPECTSARNLKQGVPQQLCCFSSRILSILPPLPRQYLAATSRL